VAVRGGEQTGSGRKWGLPLADRVLLIATYYRTNLTLRQVAVLFGVSKSAAHWREAVASDYPGTPRGR
jgi:hypothetical protein